MMLPNGNRAVVDIRKLRDYCLNPDNPRGCNKARVFASALGMLVRDSEKLRATLLRIAVEAEAQLGEVDRYGQRYTIDFEMTTEIGAAQVRCSWIILHNEKLPRLTTCYVKKRKR